MVGHREKPKGFKFMKEEVVKKEEPVVETVSPVSKPKKKKSYSKKSKSKKSE